MKKIIACLFVGQLIIMTSYAFLFFRTVTINNLFSQNLSVFEVDFSIHNQEEEYELFRDFFADEGIEISRIIYTDETVVNIYTASVEFWGRARLITGRWPQVYTDEFVATFDSGEAAQVGKVQKMIPGFDITMNYLDGSRNIPQAGMYYVSVSDAAVVDYILRELSDIIYSVELISFDTNTMSSIFAGFTTQQIFEVIIVTPLIFMCVFMAMLMYSVDQLKSCAIFLLHGYSKSRLAKITVLNIVKPLALSSMMGFILFLLYGLFSVYAPFLSILSFYYALLCVALIFVYTAAVNIFVYLYLRKLSAVSIIKEEKPYYFMQVTNHLLKMAFMAF